MPYLEPTDAHSIQDHRGPFKDSKGNMQPGYLDGGNPREYPKLMYPLKGGFPKPVSDPKEQAAAEKEGFTAVPKAECITPAGMYKPPKEEPAAAPAIEEPADRSPQIGKKENAPRKG